MHKTTHFIYDWNFVCTINEFATRTFHHWWPIECPYITRTDRWMRSRIKNRLVTHASHRFGIFEWHSILKPMWIVLDAWVKLTFWNSTSTKMEIFAHECLLSTPTLLITDNPSLEMKIRSPKRRHLIEKLAQRAVNNCRFEISQMSHQYLSVQNPNHRACRFCLLAFLWLFHYLTLHWSDRLYQTTRRRMKIAQSLTKCDSKF